MSDVREVHVEITTRSDGRAYARSEHLGLFLSDDRVEGLLPIIPDTLEKLFQHGAHVKASATLQSSVVAGGTTTQTYLIEFGDE